MNVLAWLLVLLIGAALPLQALVNARLAQLSYGPLFAALVSFCVGTLALAAGWLWMRPQAIDIATLARMPWWAWSGGVFGAAFVAVATLMIPRMGAASLICVVVFGQMAGSLLLDHFGVLHPRQPADGLRLFGVVLVAVGALLVVKPWQQA